MNGLCLPGRWRLANFLGTGEPAVFATCNSRLQRLLAPTPLCVAIAAAVAICGCAPPPEIVIVTPPPTGRSGSAAAAAVAANQPAKAMYQLDAQHSGRSPFVGPRQAVLLRTFDTTTIDTPEPGDPQPDIQGSTAIGADGTIYVGNFTGNVFALRDPGSGSSLELAWRFHPAGASPFSTTPAIGRDGTVYVGFSSGGDSPEAREIGRAHV